MFDAIYKVFNGLALFMVGGLVAEYLRDLPPPVKEGGITPEYFILVLYSVLGLIVILRGTYEVIGISLGATPRAYFNAKRWLTIGGLAAAITLLTPFAIINSETAMSDGSITIIASLIVSLIAAWIIFQRKKVTE